MYYVNFREDGHIGGLEASFVRKSYYREVYGCLGPARTTVEETDETIGHAIYN